MTVRITTEHGQDVTEGVQAAYDLVVGSMDWGSGFLSVEDVLPLLRLAVACGYKTDDIETYMRSAYSDTSRYLRDETERKRGIDEACRRVRAEIEEIRRELGPPSH